MLKNFLLLFVFIMGNYILSAQGNKIKLTEDRLDTTMMKNNALAFLRLTLSRSSPDSIIKLMGFPFYEKSWHKIKLYRSAFELKKEIVKDRKRSSSIVYTIENISKVDSCINSQLKTKNYVCIKIKTYRPDEGEGNEGRHHTTVFFVSKKYPYPIIGLEDEN